LGAEELQTQQKQCIVAACDGFLERKSKILMVATFGALALLGVIAASAAPPALKRTFPPLSLMSAFDPKRTSAAVRTKLL